MRFSIFAAPIVAILLCAPMSRAGESDTTVPTYHADEARRGHYVVPGLTWARAADFKRDLAFDGHVPGNVYAQPLYWRPAGAARGLVIAATEDNVVAALDAVTGSDGLAEPPRPCGPAFEARVRQHRPARRYRHSGDRRT